MSSQQKAPKTFKSLQKTSATASALSKTSSASSSSSEPTSASVVAKKTKTTTPNKSEITKQQGLKRKLSDTTLEEESESRVVATSSSNPSNNEATEQQPNKADSSVIDTSVTFAALGLSQVLCDTLKDIGYKHPTKIQREVIPVAIKEAFHDDETGFTKYNDIIGISETGSGKTASYVLPILERLLQLKGDPSPCSALILAPTRELATQIQYHVNALGSKIGITSTTLIGGTTIANDSLRFKKNRYHVVVGTPGRVCDLLQYGKSNFNLNHTRFLVLDEADKMLGSEFDKWLTVISEKLKRKQCTVYLFSATMTTKIDKLLKLHQMTNPVKIQVTSSKYHTVDTLTQQYLLVPEKYKEQYLVYLLNENPGKRILVFAGQNATCIMLSIMLRSLKFPAVPLSGHMDETHRQHCLRKFISGDRPILVATDIAARGLDIPLVEIVINFDIPAHSKEYVHRVGRTARIGNQGLAITFVTQYDLQYFQKIEALIEKKMDACPVNKENAMLLTNTVSQAAKLAKKKMSDMEKGDLPVKSDEFTEEEEVLNNAIRSLTAKREHAGKKKSGGGNSGSGNLKKKRKEQK
ncbi:hypothetical protein C9374_002558 [Naegleria lovaniensis]|uniref:Probable eukaryotic initiation factor 4A n=1 Tax=Naegleria lovaniensis TaxID=51637 RepID=A0AA88KQ72_NAELO|nr:uncharacterized protein C9374_002558 [Naegleria lovaniensis]KAG2386112.1 hypothetical protein C9374_002558 [Naegleria lovaniensis]